MYESIYRAPAVLRRNSSFDVLKIVLIFLVVASHWGWAFVNGEIPGGGYQYCFAFYRVFRSLGQFANIGFVLISGYFLCEKKFNINKILILLFDIVVVDIVLIIFYISFKNLLPHLQSISIKDVLISFIPFKENWFVWYYIVLLLMSPFLNLIINKINIKTYCYLLGSLFVVFVVIPTYIINIFSDPFFIFIFIYFVGAFINKYQELFKSKFLYLILFVICFITIICFNISNVRYTFFESISNIITVMSSIFLFLIFKNIYLESKFLKYFGSTTLGIYLLHENFVFRYSLWKDIFNFDLYTGIGFIFYSIYSVLIVVLICSIISLIYNTTLRKFIVKLLDKKIKIDEVNNNLCFQTTSQNDYHNLNIDHQVKLANYYLSAMAIINLVTIIISLCVEAIFPYRALLLLGILFIYMITFCILHKFNLIKL